MPSAALPPLFLNTENDHGARPVVLGYLGTGITILVTVIRLSLTVNRSHGLAVRTIERNILYPQLTGRTER